MNQSGSDILFRAFMSSLEEKFVFYWCVVVLSTGFLLNVFIMGIFLKKKFINNPMPFYNIAIALTGNVTIILLFLSINPQIYPQISTEFACQLLSYLIRVYSQMISWLHVMMSLDRMVSVLWPASHLLIKKRLFTRVAAIIVFICLLGINMANFWTSSFIRTKSQCQTEYSSNDAHDLISIVMQTILPIMLMIVANSVLIVSLFKQKRNLNLDRSLRREISFSVSVLAQNLLFIVFMVPEAVAVIYQYYSDYAGTTSIRLLAIISLTITCANVLSTYTICSSFLVNLAFNKIFREELNICIRSLLALVSTKYEANRRPSKRLVSGR